MVTLRHRIQQDLRYDVFNRPEPEARQHHSRSLDIGHRDARLPVPCQLPLPVLHSKSLSEDGPTAIQQLRRSLWARLFWFLEDF